MPIVGHGIDIVETARIRKLVEQHGPHFLDRVFTAAEQRYCAASPKRYFEHLAGRFAAKEAVLKVLGTGWRGGIAWTDIEVVKESSGQPRIVLTGECLRIATSAASPTGTSASATSKPTPPPAPSAFNPRRTGAPNRPCNAAEPGSRRASSELACESFQKR